MANIIVYWHIFFHVLSFPSSVKWLIYRAMCTLSPRTLPDGLLRGLHSHVGMESHWLPLFIWHWQAWLGKPNPHGTSWHSVHLLRSQSVQPGRVTRAVKRMWSPARPSTCALCQLCSALGVEVRGDSAADLTKESAIVGEFIDYFC